jgi:hypothetical protein
MVQKVLRKLSQWFWKGFFKWYDGGGENGIISKRIFELKCFSPLKILTSPLFEETLRAILSFFSLFFFLLHLLRTQGFWWYLRRKSLLQKLIFKWLQYTGGGCLFRNRVMHANMAKLRLWRWWSCGYIGGGRIFQSRVMHANIFGWG